VGAEHDGAAWVSTYSWWTGKCDPCPDGGPLEEPVLTALGFEGGVNDVHLTRLWMRYDADAAAEDLVMYTTGDSAWTQLRYIVYKEELEQQFPICIDGYAENPGTCSDATSKRSSLGAWTGFGFLGLLGVFGLALRRRR
jgi:MYXO-CTERM domain-containing protein